MACILGCNSTHFGPDEDEKEVDVSIQSVEGSLMIYGQITDCAKHNAPVPGALVKAFKCEGHKLIGICHTFSGCNGFYMLNLPGVQKGEKVIVMATCGCITASFCVPCHADCKCC